jgi:hypothetical protein
VGAVHAGPLSFRDGCAQDVVGDSLQVDEVALDKGVLILEFDWPLDGRSIPLRAIYPDSFPRLRPIVKLRGDTSTFPPRHCSPIDGNLCLLGRDSRQWRQKWTLRNLLESQLQSALTGGGEEDQQGEPAEYWWNHCGWKSASRSMEWVGCFHSCLVLRESFGPRSRVSASRGRTSPSFPRTVQARRI